MTDREAYLAACFENPTDDKSWNAYADWLRERNENAEAERVVSYVKSLDPKQTRYLAYGPDVQDAGPVEYRNYNWTQAFGYAGEPGTYNRDPVKISTVPQAPCPTTPFARHHVAEIFGMSEGENDRENWITAGRLWDGRWFVLEAGCDYTGWD